mgnify:CR=1 FL=1
MRPKQPSGPGQALTTGTWVKWIGGASNHDLAALEDLAGLAALAGADCLDVAADAAVVAAVRRGMAWAQQQGRRSSPWLMVSLSDGEDPHFRKAFFDPSRCPADCPRPCAKVCPPLAIPSQGGVLAERCYGCGRCLPVCPLGLIEERSMALAAEALPALLQELQPDAIELHTHPGRAADFAQRLQQIERSGLALQLLSVSCADGPGDALPQHLWQLHQLLQDRPWPWLWQLDGRPMSGDIGAGTAQAAVNLLRRRRGQLPPGRLQLAGGTNHDSRRRLEREGLAGAVAGIAYGGSARKLIQPLLQQAQARGEALRACPDLCSQALAQLQSLFGGPGRAGNC